MQKDFEIWWAEQAALTANDVSDLDATPSSSSAPYSSSYSSFSSHSSSSSFFCVFSRLANSVFTFCLVMTRCNPLLLLCLLLSLLLFFPFLLFFLSFVCLVNSVFTFSLGTMLQTRGGLHLYLPLNPPQKDLLRPHQHVIIETVNHLPVVLVRWRINFEQRLCSLRQVSRVATRRVAIRHR